MGYRRWERGVLANVPTATGLPENAVRSPTSAGREVDQTHCRGRTSVLDEFIHARGFGRVFSVKGNNCGGERKTQKKKGNPLAKPVV